MSAIGLATKGMITMSRIIESGGGGSGGGAGGDGRDDRRDPKIYFQSLTLGEIKDIVADMEKEAESKIKVQLTLEDEDENTSN